MEKKRCHNFTSAEIELLVSLVEEFKDIVECKKTDTVTNSTKEAEWQKIQSRFNAISGTATTAKMLRSKWDSLKKSTKKQFAELKQSLYKTGGGPSSSGALDVICNRVLAIIGVGATGVTSRFDSDFDIPVTEPIGQESDSTVSEIAIELNKSASPEDITEEVYEPSCSWKNWNPQQLRQPKSKALQIPEDKAACMTVLTVNDEIILQQKNESANGTPVTLETPKCSSNNKKKRYKAEPIPSIIRSKKNRYEQLQEELVLKKMQLIDMQIRVVKEEREEKRALFQIQKEEALQKAKQIAEKHELEIKVLLADLEGKKKNYEC